MPFRQQSIAATARWTRILRSTAIATATGNPQFTRFLEYLGRFIIPRRSIWKGADLAERRIQLDIFQKEHEQIVQAIQAGAVSQARAAMQRHLLNSRQRYQKLAAEHAIK